MTPFSAQGCRGPAARRRLTPARPRRPSGESGLSIDRRGGPTARDCSRPARLQSSPNGLAPRLRGRVPVGFQPMRAKRSFRGRHRVVPCRWMRGRVIGPRGGRPGGGRRRVARPGRRMRLAARPLDSRRLSRVPGRPLGLDLTGGEQPSSRQDSARQRTRLQEERGQVETRQTTVGPDEAHGVSRFRRSAAGSVRSASRLATRCRWLRLGEPEPTVRRKICRSEKLV